MILAAIAAITEEVLWGWVQELAGRELQEEAEYRRWMKQKNHKLVCGQEMTSAMAVFELVLTLRRGLGANGWLEGNMGGMTMRVIKSACSKRWLVTSDDVWVTQPQTKNSVPLCPQNWPLNEVNKFFCDSTAMNTLDPLSLLYYRVHRATTASTLEVGSPTVPWPLRWLHRCNTAYN